MVAWWNGGMVEWVTGYFVMGEKVKGKKVKGKRDDD